MEFEGPTLSRRCQGVGALDVDHKFQQAEPLSVKQLKMLHRILFDDAEIWNQVFAGMLLFCVYARSHGMMLNMVTVSWRTSTSQGAVHT